MLSPATMSAFVDELQKIAHDHAAPSRPNLTKEQLARRAALWTSLRGRSPVPVNIDSAEAQNYGGGFFHTGNKDITVGEGDWESLAHEMGHAELDQHVLGRLIQSGIARTAHHLTPVGGALGGALVARGKKIGLLIPLLMAAPTVLSEYLSTQRGQAHLEQVGATPEEIDGYRIGMVDGLASYLAIAKPAVVSGALGYLAAS
jgi:hypothetical protein